MALSFSDHIAGHTGYQYIEDLLALDHCTGRALAPLMLMGTLTPLNVDTWAAMLSRHPDQQYTSYICRGLRYGF